MKIRIPKQYLVWIAVFVAALGYFVDVFDMWLFANLRVQSLTDLGLSGQSVTDSGLFILNCQQAGFLCGGFLWGLVISIMSFSTNAEQDFGNDSKSISIGNLRRSCWVSSNYSHDHGNASSF